MTEIELTKLFKTYKGRLAECCSIERYNFVFSGSHFMLDDQFDDLSKEIHKTVSDNSSLEMFKPLRDFLEVINNDYRKSYNSPEQYGKKSAKQYKKIYDSLSSELHYLNGKAADIPTVKSSTELKRPLLTEFNKPSINKRQVLALMQLFREYQLVNKDLTDKALAECFGFMTGYTGSQLRKDYSEIKKNEILFKEEEIDTLRDILTKMNKDLTKLPIK